MIQAWDVAELGNGSCRIEYINTAQVSTRSLSRCRDHSHEIVILRGGIILDADCGWVTRIRLSQNPELSVRQRDTVWLEK